MRKLVEPLVAMLLAAAAVSTLSGDWVSSAVILVVVFLSVTIDSVQEHSAEAAVAALQRSVALQAIVRRDGQFVRLPVDEIVPGDIVSLKAGDLVPADGLIVASRNARADEALLTGEPYPVDKEVRAGTTPGDTRGILFAGTALVNGEATLQAIATGPGTRLGQIAKALAAEAPQTPLERGVHRLGVVVLRLTILLVLFVLLSQLALHRPPLESFLFAVAIAVGLTPELLPMVMSVTLARGAVRMASRRVIVKTVSAIHDLGAMDILCTDKTGTLTEAAVELAQTLGPDGAGSPRVAMLARLNSRFVSGLTTPLDDAILAASSPEEASAWAKVADAPFDFERRRASVLVERERERLLVVKGAPEHLLPLCARIEPRGGDGAVSDIHVAELCRSWAEGGFRLLAVAWKTMPDGSASITPADEEGLTLAGFCLFQDPPKKSATEAIERLGRKGVTVKIVSGDDPVVARHLFRELGLPTPEVLTGAEVETLSNAQLAQRVAQVGLYARVSPEQKSRVVQALKRRGHVVGFMGDGINDAPAIRAADVGLAVAEGSAVAREAADMVLLTQDLNVVADGVDEGRRTLANIMKYVRAGASSNLGNMISMAVAPLLLPFLPLLPIQVLINNLIYDLSELGIPFDSVDPEEIAAPHGWDIGSILRFALVMGVLSSLFDMATFSILRWVFEVDAGTFRTAWFVESMATQILVVFVIRTNGSALKSAPHPALVASSLLALACALLLASSLGAPLGFVVLPGAVWASMVALTLAYLVAAELAKHLPARWASASHRDDAAPRHRRRGAIG